MSQFSTSTQNNNWLFSAAALQQVQLQANAAGRQSVRRKLPPDQPRCTACALSISAVEKNPSAAAAAATLSSSADNAELLTAAEESALKAWQLGTILQVRNSHQCVPALCDYQPKIYPFRYLFAHLSVCQYGSESSLSLVCTHLLIALSDVRQRC
jgi:hypothetical protein